MATIANAYVQILPSMEGMQEELQSQMDGPASKAGAAGGQKAGSSFISKMGKAVALLGIGKLIGNAISSSADLQQSIGGVETLFKDAAGTVIENANRAFATSGLSANDYMETVTSFSASLLQSLGGDTNAAAALADQALQDMSDNANKMGTDMAMIQSAYMGFSRQNYTMLDNLKLGYGGTKTEMERLLADAQELTGVEYNIDNLSDVYEAIHAIQENIGITGATADEAEKTISGSINMVKASAENLVASLATGQGFEEALRAFGESGITALRNIIPAAVTAVNSLLPLVVQGIAEFLPQLVALAGQAVTMFASGLKNAMPAVVAAIGTLSEQIGPILSVITTSIIEALPMILEAAFQLVNGLVTALPEIVMALVSALPTVIETLVSFLTGEGLSMLIAGCVQAVVGLVSALPEILLAMVQAMPTVIDAVISGLMSALPQLIAGCIQVVIALVGALPQIVLALLQAIPTIVVSIATSFVDNWPTFRQAFLDIFTNLRDSLPDIISGFWEGCKNLVVEIGSSIGELTSTFISSVGQWISSMWQAVRDGWPGFVENVKSFVKSLPSKMIEALSNIASVGSHIIEGIWNGLSAGWDWLVGKVRSIASSLLSAAKSALGISSPSKEFAWIGEMVTEGLGEGLEQTKPIEDAMDDMIDLTTGTLTPDVMLSGSVEGPAKVQKGGNVVNNSFVINAADGQDVLEIAYAVRDILTDEVYETEAVYA